MQLCTMLGIAVARSPSLMHRRASAFRSGGLYGLANTGGVDPAYPFPVRPVRRPGYVAVSTASQRVCAVPLPGCQPLAFTAPDNGMHCRASA